MTASKGLLLLAETGCNRFLQILKFAKISWCFLKIAVSPNGDLHYISQSVTSQSVTKLLLLMVIYTNTSQSVTKLFFLMVIYTITSHSVTKFFFPMVNYTITSHMCPSSFS